MKKFTILILTITLLLLFSSCNNQNTKIKEDKTEENKITAQHFFKQTTTNAVIENDYLYEEVVLEVMGIKTTKTIDSVLNSQLEQAKNVSTTLLDDSMKEIGTIWVKHKDGDELIEFGKVYSGRGSEMYIQSFENEHNGVLLISEENEETNTNILF